MQFLLTRYPLRPSPATTTKPCLKRTKKPTILIVHIFLSSGMDDQLCYVETRDEKYVGHFFLRRVEITLHGLSIELDRPNDNLLTVPMAPSPNVTNGTVGFR